MCRLNFSICFYLQKWRQLVYELAEIYSAMATCKLSIINQSDDRPDQHSMNKFNSLSEKSISKYLQYVTSLKTPNGKMPDPLPEGKNSGRLVCQLVLIDNHNCVFLQTSVFN